MTTDQTSFISILQQKPKTDPNEPTGPIGMGGVGLVRLLLMLSLIMTVQWWEVRVESGTTGPLLTPAPALTEPHNVSELTTPRPGEFSLLARQKHGWRE